MTFRGYSLAQWFRPTLWRIGHQTCRVHQGPSDDAPRKDRSKALLTESAVRTAVARHQVNFRDGRTDDASVAVNESDQPILGIAGTSRPLDQLRSLGGVRCSVELPDNHDRQGPMALWQSCLSSLVSIGV